MGDSTPFRVVSVVSCKGGVGKSMVAANLALELKKQGVKVGLLDADIDSPYLVEIVGVKGHIDLSKDRHMIPVQYDGMPIMSFALWVPDKFVGASMPGSMHEQWITDALGYTDWGDIDVLVVDLPAGLGDEYLRIIRMDEKRRLGMVVVALPNVLSGLKRVYETASYHHLRILGVIENMAGPVFGSGSIKTYCDEMGLQFFGSIPADKRIRLNHEINNPRIPEELSQPIQNACKQVMAKVVSA